MELKAVKTKHLANERTDFVGHADKKQAVPKGYMTAEEFRIEAKRSLTELFK
jgi:hypothetical protein